MQTAVLIFYKIIIVPFVVIKKINRRRRIMGTFAPCFCGGKRAAPILSRCSVVAAQTVHLVPSKPRAKTDPAPCSAQNTTLPHTASTVCNQNVLCF